MVQRSEALILVVGFLLTALGVSVFLLGHGRSPPPRVLRGVEADKRIALRDRPLSSMVALVLEGEPEGEGTIPARVRESVEAYGAGLSIGAGPFPLGSSGEDAVRALPSLTPQVVAHWLLPLTPDDGFLADRFGANADYLAWFGDGWDLDWKETEAGRVVGRAPQGAGSSIAGWMWSNHEYVSFEDGNQLPTLDNAPVGQPRTLALWLRKTAVLRSDVLSSHWRRSEVDTFIRWHKKQVGASWFRVAWDAVQRAWVVEPHEDAKRYDATKKTLLKLTAASTARPGREAEGVVVGITGDCSGLQTPWGTILSAEENVQDYYGDLEACWPSSNNDFVAVGAGAGYAPGRIVEPPWASSQADPQAQFGRISKDEERHDRDVYGWLAELDPGRPADEWYGRHTSGVGHRKLGAIGRARWENATVVVDDEGQLESGRPLVLYATNDRRGGRIYKWVSREPFERGMTRPAVRALLDDGTLYVAHVEGLDNRTGLHHHAPDVPDDALVDGGSLSRRLVEANLVRPSAARPLEGRWIRLSLDSPDAVPNAAALDKPGTTVGAALRDLAWNGIGGFDSENLLRKNLFTAAMKLGVMELNRPEDVEWNPRDRRLYLALTKHGRTPGLMQDGRLDAAGDLIYERPDREGAIWCIQEADPAAPHASTTFRVHEVWQGWGLDQVDPSTAAFVPGADPRVVLDPRFATVNPDNIAIDRDGGVWFGTDGAFGHSRGRVPDALYFLDLESGSPTEGLAFRIATCPSDAEATGPCFTPNERTLFFNAQHPGENIANDVHSHWPPRPVTRAR